MKKVQYVRDSIKRSGGAGGGDEDFIQTPRIAVDILLTHEQFDGLVWEPACGRGAISKVLKEKGLKTWSTDLIDRGYGDESGVDFLKTNRAVDNIVTNPPYSLLPEFVARCRVLSRRKFALLLPLVALSSAMRRASAVSEPVPPARIYVFKRKIPWVNQLDQEMPSIFPHMWAVWERNGESRTGLFWV